MLIRCAISEEALPEATSARRLLSIIKQRHPNAFNEAADGLCEEDEDVVASVEQLIISLSVVRYHIMYQPIFLITYLVVLQVPATRGSSEAGRNVDMILATSNADAKVRAIAVKDLLDSLSKEELVDPAELVPTSEHFSYII
jgi:U3 small nucleolar RNA-associated protein 10